MKLLIILLFIPVFVGGGDLKKFVPEFNFKMPPKVTAIAAVQTTNDVNTGSDLELCWDSPTTIGTLVIVHIVLSTTARTVTSVEDDGGNTYIIGTAIDNTCRVYQAYGIQDNSANCVIVGLSGLTNFRVGIDEYSGLAATNAAVYDQRSTGTGTGTAMAASTLTPSCTGILIVATGGTGGGTSTWTEGSGFTNFCGAGATTTIQSEYKLSGAATETAPWTLGTSRAWAEIVTSYKTSAPCGGINYSKFFFKP